MKFIFKIIILFLFLFNLIYPLHDIFVKNEAQINFKNDLVEEKDVIISSRKALFAAGLSAVLPGAGQFYLGNNVAGSIYMAVEASLWLTRDHYLDEAVLSSEAYKQHARDYWSFPKWIRDYYNPSMSDVLVDIELLPVSDEDDSVYTYVSAYVVTPDDIYSEFILDEENDNFNLYYHLLWDQGHSAEFDYDGTIVSTEDQVTFKPIYEDVCNTSAELNYICLLNIESYEDENEIPTYGSDEYYDMLLNQINNKINGVIYSHHLYEGIGKYNMFFAGWVDSNDSEVISGPAGNFDILSSPRKLFYEHTLRARHKENNDKAGNLLSLLLVNRAISMFNILLNESRFRVSSDVNPSKYATNEIKLSIGF